MPEVSGTQLVSVDGSENLKTLDATPAFEAPCIRCGKETTVTEFALEFCRLSNHVLKAMGERLMRKSEIALCPSCYDEHYDALWTKQRKTSDGYVYMWNSFKGAWLRAKDQQQRDMLEAKLRDGLGDYWPSYKPLLADWTALQRSKRGRDKGQGQAGRVGF